MASIDRTTRTSAHHPGLRRGVVRAVRGGHTLKTGAKSLLTAARLWRRGH
jgi:hypothetical protein